nr:hypothetical protein [Planctomycetota bacterium]
AWRGAPVAVEVLPARALLPRIVPPAAYTTRAPMRISASGEAARDMPPAKLARFWWQDQVPSQIAGFAQADLATDPLNALQAKPTARIVRASTPYDPTTAIALADHGFAILDLGDNLTGFFSARVRCDRPCRLIMLFDEVARDDGDVDFMRACCVNAIEWTLAAGDYALETIEPYTARHLKLLALDGGCAVHQVALRGYGNSESGRAAFACADRRLVRVFEAARATFAQNALDVFMDCPSRERAGWLCDSYFTGRVALDLCGTTTVERAFLENFLLPERFPGLPDGMLPMCYPADHDDGNFIPNWAMWFVLELEEYLARSGDRALIEDLKPRVAKLIAYLRGFENADGLLEKLPKWVFVEWSKANDFVQDVNYPSNMLWAGMLDAAARLYGVGEWSDRAARVRATVRGQSFDGTFFVDNAVRQDGVLARTTNTTEVCQYFAFYFGVADRQRDAALWRILVDDFGPQRKASGKHPTVHPANAFIGNYVRLELLSAAGLAKQALDETLGYFLFMAERTGTLWENDGAYASCNHGFASHVAHLYYRDVLGLAEVDVVRRRLTLRFNPHDLDWCEGRVPVGGDEAIEVGWWKDGDALRWRCALPAGWTLTVDDRTGRAVRA